MHFPFDNCMPQLNLMINFQLLSFSSDIQDMKLYIHDHVIHTIGKQLSFENRLAIHIEVHILDSEATETHDSAQVDLPL
jgi:hypothetical protein